MPTYSLGGKQPTYFTGHRMKQGENLREFHARVSGTRATVGVHKANAHYNGNPVSRSGKPLSGKWVTMNGRHTFIED